MDFLENIYIEHVRGEVRRRNIYSHRRSEDIMRELRDKHFKSHFRFSKENVREIVNILDGSLR